MPIKAILFDAGNTLIFIDPNVVLPILTEYGGSADETAYWKAEFHARTLLTKRIEEGAYGTEDSLWMEYFQNLFHACGISRSELETVGARIKEAHDDSHLWSYMNPATPAALDRLKDAGYRLAVISNADGRMEGLIQRVGIHNRFEFVMDSAVEGVEKPDPEIFLRGCRRLGLDPGDVLYVGDLYPVDVLGARSAGLEAVLLDPMDGFDYPVDRVRDVAALPDYMDQRSSRP